MKADKGDYHRLDEEEEKRNRSVNRVGNGKDAIDESHLLHYAVNRLALNDTLLKTSVCTRRSTLT